ncbi:GNAT family N-acetyltransferase [Rubricoccus marinus]|uniref:GNAT family N-acetyltransferase n=1 Tax=Rubricoccus marinus TaxID=716817 RepID=UPI000B999A35|nr:GNAT family N-acetyltransferase [Rubricoccus marinus]
MALDVRPVQTRRERRAFLALPYRLYRGTPWVAPLRRDQRALLNPRKNPFFEHGTLTPFLAWRDGRVVGRVAAITNGRYNERHSDGAAFFGFFDVEDDREAAVALLDTAREHLAAGGYARVRGPFSPSFHDVAALLVDGFDRRPALMMPYNPEYLVGHVEAAGFETILTLSSYHAAWKHLDRQRLARGAALVRQRHPGLRLRAADPGLWRQEALVIRDLYARAFDDTPHWVPLSDAEFDHMERGMREVLDPRLVLILEDDGEPVGFFLALPDANEVLQHNPSGRLFPGAISLMLRAKLAPPRTFRTILLGVLPEVRRRGYETILIHELIERGRLAGYPASELGWVMDTNATLTHAIEKFGGVRDKRYAVVERSAT